jgi:hypothetical protein
MGFHLPGPTKGKVEHLIATYGAERISKPPEAFHAIPESKALICVVDTVTRNIDISRREQIGND